MAAEGCGSFDAVHADRSAAADQAAHPLHIHPGRHRLIFTMHPSSKPVTLAIARDTASTGPAFACAWLTIGRHRRWNTAHVLHRDAGHLHSHNHLSNPSPPATRAAAPAPSRSQAATPAKTRAATACSLRSIRIGLYRGTFYSRGALGEAPHSFRIAAYTRVADRTGRGPRTTSRTARYHVDGVYVLEGRNHDRTRNLGGLRPRRRRLHALRSASRWTHRLVIPSPSDRPSNSFRPLLLVPVQVRESVTNLPASCCQVALVRASQRRADAGRSRKVTRP